MTNRKRGKKKLPPLGLTCAFCRSPIHENESELISRFEKRIKKGDTQAMLNLAFKFKDGTSGIRKNDEKALELFHRAADLGFAEAIGQLGYWAMNGSLDSIPDKAKAKQYIEDAVVKGSITSRNNLAVLLADEGEIELAIKHWHLAAAAGEDLSMKALWKCFNKGKLSKPDLVKAMRAYKTASDEMNSEERKRFASHKKAKAGNDELLKAIYTLYYAGFINAKELKRALQAHRSGDRKGVAMLIKDKILAAGLDIESLEEQARLERRN